MTNSSLKQRRQLFPDKLWDLVNNQPSSGIQWSKSGKKIEIDRGQLERFLQTRLMDRSNSTTCQSGSTSSPSSSHCSTKFRSNNFDSFIRQLHFYGFKKSGNSYHHEKFQRDRPDMLSTMKRKYSTMPQLNSGGNQTISKILGGSGQSEQLLLAKQEGPAGMEAGGTPSSATTSSSLPSPSSSSSLSSASSSTTTVITSAASPKKQQAQKGTSHTDTIKMYTIDSVGMQDGNLSFSNVRETSVKAIRDNKSVKISIPDLMLNNHPDDSWPKTLVLENQNILSAYFIYKLN